ncbi:hypothetical protein EJ110_NYTH04393 [Nymphaea thermarum]|nr:hypothetical protein EJ110_NYTH04393 [Nymphaea thermarum]
MAAKSPVFTALQRSHFGDHGLDPQINLQVFEKTKRNRKVAMAFGRRASTTTSPSIKSLQVQNPLARGGRERNSLKKIGKVRRWWNRTLVFFWKMRRRFEPRTSLPSSYDIRRIKLGDGPSTIRACPAPIYGSADAFPRRRSLPARRGRAAEDGEFNVPYLTLKEFNMDPCRFSTPTAPIYLVT